MARVRGAQRLDAGSGGRFRRFRAAIRMSRTGVGLAVLTAAFSCAKVSEPLPPITRKLPASQDLRVVQEGGRNLYLLFGAPAAGLDEVEVYRACGSPLDGASRPIRRLRRGELSEIPGGKMLRVDDLAPVWNQPCQYGVRFRAAEFKPSELSNRVTTQVGSPPPVPTDLKVEVREKELILTWDLADAAGAPREGFLVNGATVTEAKRYVDRAFTFGEPRRYTVQTVGRLLDPTILSAAALPVTVVPQDTFPPEAPRHLTAVRVAEQVQLIWDAGSESDLVGYRVYRREGSGAFVLIADAVSVSRYLDPHPPVGLVAYYVVTALDRNANESKPSEMVQSTHPQ